MNKVVLIGRLTRDPDVRYSQGDSPMAVARYSLAVNRKFRREGQQDADFINIVAFGKNGEFAEKYLKKGMQICVVGRIQTGSYTDKEGRKIYTTDIVVEEHEFTESKKAFAERSESGFGGNQSGGWNSGGGNASQPSSNSGFVPVASDDEDLPF